MKMLFPGPLFIVKQNKSFNPQSHLYPLYLVCNTPLPLAMGPRAIPLPAELAAPPMVIARDDARPFEAAPPLPTVLRELFIAASPSPPSGASSPLMQLPNLGTPSAWTTETPTSRAGQWELLVWICVFGATRLSPSASYPFPDDPTAAPSSLATTAMWTSPASFRNGGGSASPRGNLPTNGSIRWGLNGSSTSQQSPRVGADVDQSAASAGPASPRRQTLTQAQSADDTASDDTAAAFTAQHRGSTTRPSTTPQPQLHHYSMGGGMGGGAHVHVEYGDGYIPVNASGAVRIWRALKQLTKALQAEASTKDAGDAVLGAKILCFAVPPQVTPSVVLRWSTSPQLFGCDARKWQTVLNMPPHQRTRRDRGPLRRAVERVLSDSYAAAYLLWCAGDFQNAVAVPYIGTESNVQPLSRDAFGDSFRSECVTVASFTSPPRTLMHHAEKGVAAAGSSAASFASFRRRDEHDRRAVSLMVQSLLHQYMWGFIETFLCDDSVDLTIRGTGSLTLLSEVIPSLPLTDHGAPLGAGRPVSRLREPLTCIRWRALTQLSVSHCGLLHLEGIAAACPLLRSVVASENRIRRLPLGFFAALSGTLETVVLDGNLLEDAASFFGLSDGVAPATPPPSAPAVSCPTVLKDLSLCFNLLDQEFVDVLFAIGKQSVPGADVNSVDQGVVGPPSPYRAHFPGWQSLQILDLSNNKGIRRLPCTFAQLCGNGDGGDGGPFPRLRRFGLRGVHRLDDGFIRDVLAATAAPAATAPVIGRRRRLVSVELPLMGCSRVGQTSRIPLRPRWTLRRVVHFITTALYCCDVLHRIAARKALSACYRDAAGEPDGFRRDEPGAVPEVSSEATHRSVGKTNRSVAIVKREADEAYDLRLRPSHQPSHLMTAETPGSGLSLSCGASAHRTLSIEGERRLSLYATRRRSLHRRSTLTTPSNGADDKIAQ